MLRIAVLGIAFSAACALPVMNVLPFLVDDFDSKALKAQRLACRHITDEPLRFAQVPLEAGSTTSTSTTITTVYTLEKMVSSSTCDQADILAADVAAAQKVDKNLKVGTCTSAGYSVADGTTMRKVPGLGMLAIKQFKREARTRIDQPSYEYARMRKKFKREQDLLNKIAAPSGTYVGHTSLHMGDVKVNGTVKIDDATTLDILVTGHGKGMPASVTCKGQKFSVASNGAITLPQDKDTCIYKLL